MLFKSPRKWPLQVFAMELRKIITYRADFWVNFLGQTIFSITLAYFLWDSIFTESNTEEINGFTMKKLMLYYLIAPLIVRIQQGESIGAISQEIYQGTLNKFLLYPINFYKYKLTTYFAHSSFYLLQLFILLGLYNAIFYDPTVYQFSVTSMLMFIPALALISLTFFCLNSMSELVAFWAEYIWSLGVLVRFFVSFFGGAMIPLTFFPGWAQEALAYTPFPYLVHFPMQILFGEVDLPIFATNMGILSIWCLVFYSLSIVLWNKGKYSYTGVGI